MDFSALISAFILVLVSELGDKTMITVVTLASERPRTQVFAGALLALSMLTVIGALVGSVVYELVPTSLVTLVAALVFLSFGAYTLITRAKEENVTLGQGGAFLQTFSLLSLMEVGDKSQLAVVALAAGTGEVAMVALGAISAFVLITGISALIGERIGCALPREKIRLGSGVVFIIFGVVFILQLLF